MTGIFKRRVGDMNSVTVWHWFGLAVLLVLLMVLFLVVTTPPDTGGGVDEVDQPKYGEPVDAAVFRHVDEEAGVVCWTGKNSISCLPIWDTLLGWGK